MYAKAGQAGVLIAHFVASGAAAGGLTVTGKVWEISDAGAKSPNDTTGTTLTVTEIGGGLYKAPYTMSADGVPIASFATTGTADVKSVPASFVHLGLLDTIVTNIGDVHATDLPALKAVVDNIHDTDLPAVKTDTAAVKAKTDNLPASPAAVGSAMGAVASVTAKVAATIAAGDIATDAITAASVKADAVAKIQSGLSTLAAGAAMTLSSAYDAAKTALQSGGSVVASNMVAAAPTAATVAQAVWDVLTSAATTTGSMGKRFMDFVTTLVYAAPPAAAPSAVSIRTEMDSSSTKLANLDAAVSTRLATSGYTTPPTTAQIEAALLNEGDSSALLQAIADKVSGDWSAGDVSATAVASAVRTNLATELARIDAAISTRLAAAGYTAPPAAAPSASDNATAVWGAGTKALTDKAGFSLATAPPTAAAISTAVWSETVRSLTTFGTLVADAAAAVWAAATRTLSAFGFTPNAGNMVAAAPSVTQVSADAARLVALVENAGGHDRFTAAALETAPTGAGGGAADLTPVTDAIAALHDFDPAIDTVARVTLVDTVTTNTDMVAEAPAAITGFATELNATANRNTVVGAIGGGEVTAGTAFTEASEDSAGNVIGITTPGATIRAYAASDTALATALRRTTAGAQGRWTIYLEPDADYLLAFTKDGYYDAEGNDSVLTVEVSA